MRRDLLFPALLVGATAALAAVFYETERRAAPALDLDALAAVPGDGTPARWEREFKLRLEVPDVGPYLVDDGLSALLSRIHDGLRASLRSEDWAAPRAVGNPYRVDRDPLDMVARDIYLDTEGGDLARHAISYRLRNRFMSVAGMDRHERNPAGRRGWPYRSEIQTKVDRQELGDGRSRTLETRFEFRVESKPFSPDNPPPPPPWYPHEYVPYLQTGRFDRYVINASADLARFLRGLGYAGRMRLRPELVIVTTRMRSHLDIRTDYGSGPNPEQAWIVTLDRSDVFPGAPYMEFLARSWYEDGVRPAAAGTFIEVEIEFERNVSTRLDEVIEKGGEDARACEAIRDAFLSDQERIRRVVETSLAPVGIRLRGVDESKYQSARDCLARGR